MLSVIHFIETALRMSVIHYAGIGIIAELSARDVTIASLLKFHLQRFTISVIIANQNHLLLDNMITNPTWLDWCNIFFF